MLSRYAPHAIRSTPITALTRLARLDGMPAELWAMGRLPPNKTPWLAVVGTRRHSITAGEIVNRLIPPLARAGVVIVSGLAYGIDALAHQACLDAGGTTVAVLGSALDDITPSGNRPLAQQIVLSGGALLSEYPPGATLYPSHFPARNRIIAGAADATLIIEAPLKSGALITARCARRYGRPLLTVPGSILSDTAAGTNALLRTGATPVTSVNHIAQALKISLTKSRSMPPIDLSKTERTVLACLSTDPQLVDQIALACILEPSVALAALTRLELAGLARNLGGMVFVRRSPQ